jgi:hypothetical protein
MNKVSFKIVAIIDPEHAAINRIFASRLGQSQAPLGDKHKEALRVVSFVFKRQHLTEIEALLVLSNIPTFPNFTEKNLEQVVAL